jgi:hypothetical protein
MTIVNLGVLLALVLTAWWLWWWLSRPLSQIPTDVIALLKLQPERWEWSEKYRATTDPSWIRHPCGISLYVRLGSYPLEIQVSSDNRAYAITPRLRERRAIWKAFKRWEKAHPFVDELERSTAFYKAVARAYAP